MDYFWSPNKACGKERKRKEKKRKKGGEIKPRYGFLYGYMTLVWNCRDFGVILYMNYLDMIARVFLED